MADRTLEIAIKASASQFIGETGRAKQALASLQKELSDTKEANKQAQALARLKREMRLTEEGQRAEATLKSLSSEARSSVDTMDRLSDGVRRAALGFVGAATAFASVGAVLSGLNRLFGDSFQRLQDGEREAVMLAASFRFTGEESAYLADQVAKISAQTKFLPGDITMAQAAILKFGASGAELEALLPAAANLARAFNVDIVTAANAVARGIAGDGEALRQFGVVVSRSQGKGEKLAAVLLAAGQAAEANKGYTDTYAGALDSLALSWDNLTSRLGDALKDEGKATLEFLDKAIQKTESWVDKLDRAGAFDWSRIASVLTGRMPSLEEARRTALGPRVPEAIRNPPRPLRAPQGPGIRTLRDLRGDLPPPGGERGRAEDPARLMERSYALAKRTAELTYTSLREQEDIRLKILAQERNDTRLNLDTRLRAEEEIRRIYAARGEREARAAGEVKRAAEDSDRERKRAQEESERERKRAQEELDRDALEKQRELDRQAEEAARKRADITIAAAREASALASKAVTGQTIGGGDIAGAIAGLITVAAGSIFGPLGASLAGLIADPITAFFKDKDDRDRRASEELEAAAQSLKDAGKSIRERLLERATEAYLASLPPEQREAERKRLDRTKLLGEIRQYGAGLGLSQEELDKIAAIPPKPQEAPQRRTQILPGLDQNWLGKLIFGPPPAPPAMPKAPAPAPPAMPKAEEPPATKTVPTVENVGVEGAVNEIRALINLLEQGFLDRPEQGATADRPLFVYDTRRDESGFGFAPRAFFFRGRIGTPRNQPAPQAQGLSRPSPSPRRTDANRG